MTCPTCLNENNPGNQCPPLDVVLPYFAEIVINDNLIIPAQKPDVEMISNVTKNFMIQDVEVLDVNLGDVTGRKLIIAGTLALGVEYSAAVPSQEVHFAQFDIPFEAIIKARPCPGTNRGLLPPDFNIADYQIRVCVEHEQYHIVSPREISKVLVVLIYLVPLPTGLVVTKTGPDTGTVGTPITYTVTVTNNGPYPAFGVILTDTVTGAVTMTPPPPGSPCTVTGNVWTCNLDTLAAGATSTITVIVTPTAAGTVTDTATVTDLNGDVSTATVTTTVA